jgi:uncharacterized OsmC-like protein
MTSKVIYEGSLRTTATHLKSNNELITDAPTDNNGKGEAFSPTDLVATSLASCMLTIMGIVAERKGWDLTGSTATINKVMASNPRRISDIEVGLAVKVDKTLGLDDRQILENAARTCPVAESLHPNIAQKVTFIWH